MPNVPGQRRFEAELAVAKARASDDQALIAHQRLQIAKLTRALYGQRSERSVQLLDQMALDFEELESSASEDEVAAEQAVKTTNVVAFTRKRPARQPFPEHLPRERVVEPGPDGLPVLRQSVAAQTGRGHHRDAGGDPAAVEGDPVRPREIHLSRLREDVLDRRTHRRFAGIGPGGAARHRLALGLLAVDLRAQETAGEELLVGLGAIGGVGPDVAGGVVPVDQLGQQRPVVARRIGDRPAADQAMPAVDADMVLVAEGRDREIDARVRRPRSAWPWCI